MYYTQLFIRSTSESMCCMMAAAALDSVADVDQVIEIQLTLHFLRIFLSQLRRENIRMTS